MKNISYSKPIGTNYTFSTAAVVQPINTTTLVQQFEKDQSFFRNLEQQGILLDEEQLQAVRAINGPILVVAGAGSGKTRVLTSRACYILSMEQSVKPSQLMLVTFTTKAATEMVERLESMLPKEMVSEMVVGTFHSIFLHILRENGVKMNILGSEDQQRYILSGIIKDLNLKDLLSAEAVKAAISNWKNQLINWNAIQPNNAMEEKLKACYEKYEEHLYKKNLMDFDDILIYAIHFLEADSSYCSFLQQQFKYVSVDEFQDSNYLQNRLIELITTPVSNVFFVGDPKQAIYGFRHSSATFLEDLKSYYPSLQRYYLTTNYRSNDQIVGAANDVVMHLDQASKVIRSGNDALHFVRPKDVHEEAKQVVAAIQHAVEHEGAIYKDFVVLYRTHLYARAVLEEMVLEDLPLIVNGKGIFYEQLMIRQILGYLRLSVNSTNHEAISDVATTLYINRELALEHSAMELAAGKEGLHVLEGLTTGYKTELLIKRAALIEKLSVLAPKSAIQKIRKEFYDKYVKSTMEDSLHQDMVNDTLDELETSAQRFMNIQDFISFIDTFIAKCKGLVNEDRKDGVQLMTIHQSKGLEFDQVILIGVSDRIIPHHSAITSSSRPDQVLKGRDALLEENRILYVAMTRARKTLFISSPKVYHGKMVSTSRFLTGLDKTAAANNQNSR